MTNGIIQSSFNEFRAKRLGNYITHEETLHLEKEIIEKIKQEINENNINGFKATNRKGDIVLSKPEVLEKLIGDCL